MTLLALAKKLRADAQRSVETNPTALPIGTLTFSENYDELRYAEIDGIGTVTIDKSGNMVGYSPVERCTHNGQTTWIPTELMKNFRKEPFVSGRGKTAKETATT